MSTENTASQSAPARLARTKADKQKPSGIQQPAVENIEIASLQIDESYDVVGDPYNCTGQFLVDALKKKHD